MRRRSISEASRELEKLRTFRAPPPRDLTMARDLGEIEKTLRKTRGAVDKLGVAWADVVPPQLAPHTEPERLAAGVLTIRCADASAKHLFDLWLRTGGDQQLKSAVKATVRKIKLV